MGLRELATKEKLGGKSDGALTQLLKLIVAEILQKSNDQHYILFEEYARYHPS